MNVLSLLVSNQNGLKVEESRRLRSAYQAHSGPIVVDRSDVDTLHIILRLECLL